MPEAVKFSRSLSLSLQAATSPVNAPCMSQVFASA